MLTRRPSTLRCGATDRLCSTEFVGSTLCLQPRHSNGDGDRRINLTRSVQASHTSFGSRKGSASLAYVRSLSLKGRNPADPTKQQDSSVADEATVERLLVIPYSDLVLRRKLESGLSLSEASERGSENENCWEDSWKVYMQNQTGTLEELAARMQECNPHIDSTVSASLPSGAPFPKKFDERASASSDVTLEDAQDKLQRSFFSKLWAKKLGRSRTRGLMLLNVLAALYGSSTVAAKFATDAAPGLPASLSTLVRFSSALLVFLPALHHVLGRNKNPALLRAGAELGGLLFAAAVLETCGNGGASSDAPLLFAFTVIFVPIMELCAGRNSVRNITRIASLVALSGMGVLEEEGLGWKGISLPQVGDVWGLVASAVYALHIFRSEAHSKSFKAFDLSAIQCGTVAALSLVWEVSRILHKNTTMVEYMSQLQSLPWGPLIYTGLVCSGLCSWLEIHGLRSVQASTATMVNTTIPIWGAFLSFSLRGDTLDDSAIVGGLVILVASLFAQLVSKQDDPPRPQQKAATKTQPQPPVEAPGCNPAVPSDFQAQKHQPSPATSSKPVADHVQGAIITSQLKFPYYATQAKRLLVEAKLKLLFLKSLVMSATSALLTSPPPAPPSGSLHSAAAPGVIATGILESAITALSSDIVQAVEEAEDIAKLLEQAAQTAMVHMAMASTSLVDLANSIPLEIVKSVDIITTTALVDNSVDCALPLVAHHADTVLQTWLQILLTCSSHSN